MEYEQAPNLKIRTVQGE